MRTLLIVLALAATPALAQEPTPSAAPSSANAEAHVIFREVMSPFCPGLTLADCPSPNAFALRGDIERRLASGEAREAILDELVTTYGTQILADPSNTPIGSVVWGVPFLLSALAAAALAWFLRGAVRRRQDDPQLAPAGSPALNDRLNDELSRLD